MSTTAVIFGGTGFIGRHMAVHLLETGRVDRVIAADLKEIDLATCTETMKQTFQSASWEFKHCDVRDPVSWITDDTVIEIYNFAAVHREPGHDLHEYYETNLPGATNVCAWAEKVGCETITFTSSIAPYGPTENLKNENSIPTPESPYGGSKLAAEKIHETWQAAEKTNRRLVVVRPGVVFGPSCDALVNLKKYKLLH